MTRLLLVGDSHGNFPFIKQALDTAAAYEIETVISLGDFGFWPTHPNATGKRFDNRCKIAAKKLGLNLWVIDGNHDFPGKVPGDGGYKWVSDIDGHFKHLSRGSVLEIDGVRIGIMGSAISIDRGLRKIDRSYWIAEAMSEEDVERAINNGPVDIWLTHDAVELPPMLPRWEFDRPLQLDLNVQQQRMTEVFNSLKPRLHVHGHYHHRYTAPTHYGRVIGLDCENNNALVVLDPEQFD